MKLLGCEKRNKRFVVGFDCEWSTKDVLAEPFRSPRSCECLFLDHSIVLFCCRKRSGDVANWSAGAVRLSLQ